MTVNVDQVMRFIQKTTFIQNIMAQQKAPSKNDERQMRQTNATIDRQRQQ
jgi:hypothetical protein